MNTIELRQQRAAKIAEIRTLVDLIDQEARDFTPEERSKFEALMGKDGKGAKGPDGGEVGKLAKTIEEREALEAHEHELIEIAGRKPVKPDGKPVTPKQDEKHMQRSKFEELGTVEKAAFIRNGGEVVEDPAA